jgi:glycerol uptake facilitator-like aquaporin
MTFLTPKFKRYAAQCLAEAFSTFLLIFFGNMANAQYKFMKSANLSGAAANFCYGAGVYVSLMVAGPISGKFE